MQAQSKSAGSQPTPTRIQVNGSISYFKATTDLGQTYPEVPMSGSVDTIRNFAAARALPTFGVYGFPPDLAVIVYCWLAYPIVPMPLAFVYLGSDIRKSPAGLSDFFVYQFLVNLPVQQTPLDVHGNESDALSLLSPTDALYTPFIPPAPVWPSNGIFTPNPYLIYPRGGNVPCDLAGISALAGAFV